MDNTTGTVITHQFPYGHQPHEAVFAARPDGTDEDDGRLLELRHHLPLTFHGSYTPRLARPVSS